MKLKLPLNNPPGKSPQDPEALPLERVPCSVHTCKLDSTTLAIVTRTNQQRSWMHSSSNHSKKYGISGVATCKCAPAENTRRQQHISKVASARPITKRLPNVFPYKPSTARIKLEIHGNYLSLQITQSQRPNRRWPRPQTHASHPKPEPRARHEAPQLAASEPGGRAQALTRGLVAGAWRPDAGLLVTVAGAPRRRRAASLDAACGWRLREGGDWELGGVAVGTRVGQKELGAG